MRQLSILTVCILIALAVIGVYGRSQLVNGVHTMIEEYPHCVALKMNGQYFCGGSIIGSRYILTAAHCLASLTNNNLKSVTIVAGTSYLNSGGESYKIEKGSIHPKYIRNRPTTRGSNDIAVIKLTKDIKFDHTKQPINLPTKDVMENEKVTISAWGSTGLNKPVHNDLQKIEMNVMLQDKCQSYLKKTMLVYNTELCTLKTYGTGLCHGDSGSGLTQNKTIVGLVSRGSPCAQGLPDVYTKVYSFVPWIKEKMSS